jgi:hypothetical protein
MLTALRMSDEARAWLRRPAKRASAWNPARRMITSVSMVLRVRPDMSQSGRNHFPMGLSWHRPTVSSSSRGMMDTRRTPRWRKTAMIACPASW